MTTREWPLAVRVGVGRLLARYAVDLAVEQTLLCLVDRGRVRLVVDQTGDEQQLSTALQELVDRVIDRGSLVMIDDLSIDSVVQDTVSFDLEGCFLGSCAFNEAGALVGILIAHGTNARSWTNRDLERAGDTSQAIASVLIIDELLRHAEYRVRAGERARELRLQMHRISSQSASAASLPELARILVRELPDLVLCEWVIVAIADADATWHVHVSPAYADACRAVFGGQDALGDPLLEHVAELDRPGRAEITATSFPAWPSLRSQLGGMGAVRLVGAPLVANDDVAMVMLCGFRSSETSLQVDRIFEEALDDVRRAVERTAAAQRQIRAAAELQRSLLPPRLPNLAGFTIGRLYKSAADHTRVGGDWYDIVQIDSSTIGFVVGDVAGHDIRSAALMGQLRHVLASQLRDRRRPGGALAATDRYFADLAEDVMATAVVIVVDQSTSTAHVSLAGHPPPVIVAGGSASLLEAAPGPPIGFGYGGYRDTALRLTTGDRFIAYTDGVVENRTGNLAVLLAEFVAALDRESPNTVDDTVAFLNRRSQLGELVDDVAALVVEILPD